MFCWEMYFLVVNKEKKRKKEKEEPILKIHVIMDIMWRGKLGIERRGVDDYTAMLDKRVGQNIKALGSLHITRDMFRVLQHFGKAPFPWSDTHAPRLLLQSSMQTFINTCFIFSYKHMPICLQMQCCSLSRLLAVFRFDFPIKSHLIIHHILRLNYYLVPGTLSPPFIRKLSLYTKRV